MGRKKKTYAQDIYVVGPEIDADCDDIELLNNTTEEIEFSDMEDKFDFQLKLSEEKRQYSSCNYKGKKISVIPIGKFQQCNKYILKCNDGKTLIVNVNDLR